ncbi:hypothetical protein GA0115259_1008918 [Streptomyces sp. MnatMP-M17]|nr:hypothetical protein GA0115259_1008918 [Streptomyces sp. MnatMP-M17]
MPVSPEPKVDPMTESESPQVRVAPLVVLPVQEADPPFRLVEVHGELAGKAFSLQDVYAYAFAAGLRGADMDDPAVVQWLGGDQFTWKVRHWR